MASPGSGIGAAAGRLHYRTRLCEKGRDIETGMESTGGDDLKTDLHTDPDMTRASLAVVFGFALASCSSVASNIPLSSLLPPPQTDAVVTIESNPPGALASTSNGGACQTPCALSTPVTDPFTVTYTLDGYLPQTVSVRPIPAEKSALIDVTPPTLAPNPVVAQLQPAPPPPPPPIVQKRKRP